MQNDKAKFKIMSTFYDCKVIAYCPKEISNNDCVFGFFIEL